MQDPQVVVAVLLEPLDGHPTDLRDPDLDHQHLSPRRALDELDRIRRVTLTAGNTRLQVVTRRTALQQRSLDALDVDTRDWNRRTTT